VHNMALQVHVSSPGSALSQKVGELMCRACLSIYGGDSVNRSQMDTKCKTSDIRTLGKNIYFSTYPLPTLIHLSHLYSARRKPQHKSLLTVVSATSALLFQPLRRQRNVCHRVVDRFTRQTLPTVNRKHLFMNILRIESFCAQQNTAFQ
jgi:hypothetical protein